MEGSEDTSPWTDRRMGLAEAIGRDRPEVLVGVELRYVLTDLMLRSPHVWRVGELVDALRRGGFQIGEPASRVVSGALRAEIEHDRVVRVGWGRYRATNHVPGSTRRRIRSRAAARWRRVAAG